MVPLYSTNMIFVMLLRTIFNIFNNNSPSSAYIHVVDHIPCSITSVDNDVLTTLFTMDEFKQAPFEMNSDKHLQV